MSELGPKIEEWEAKRERERKRWELKEERRRKEKERRKMLKEQIEAWEKAMAIRRYLDALEKRVGDEENENAKWWISWGREYADSLDPIPLALQGKHARPQYYQ